MPFVASEATGSAASQWRTSRILRVSIDGIFGAIGRFAVRFRWFILVAWVIAAVAVPRFLPSLASVTQGNNANFLPASAPSHHATDLAKPFGLGTLTPVPVISPVSEGKLTAADVAWLGTLETDLKGTSTVVKVSDLGQSADGQAEQLQVLSSVGQGDADGLTTLVGNLRSTIAKASPPSGVQVHLAGAVAIQRDQQKKSGSTGNEEEGISVVFILILLLLIFRSLLAPLITLFPAFIAVAISGPLVGEAAQAGLKVSQIAQLMLIVLVLGAGTDYGLTLLPALLAIFGRAAFWPTRTRAGTGRVGVWGRLATRIVKRPAAALITGVVVFGALAVAVTGYNPGGFRRPPERSGRHRLRRRAGPADQALPVQQRQPDQPHLQAQAAGLGRSAGRDRGPEGDHPERAVHRDHRSARPGRRGYAHPGPVHRAAHRAGQARSGRQPARHPAREPAGVAFGVPAVPGDRPVRERGRPDLPVRGQPHGGRPVQHGRYERGPGAAAHRGAGGVRDERGGLRCGRRSTGGLRHQPDLRLRPAPRDPDRDPGHRRAAGAGHAQPGRPAVPDRLGRPVLPGRTGPVGADLHQAGRGRRADFYPAVPDVRVPAGAGRGLQHPGHVQNQGRGSPSAAAGGGEPGGGGG